MALPPQIFKTHPPPPPPPPCTGHAGDTHLGQVHEVLRFFVDLLPEAGVVIRGEGVAEDLNAGPVVEPGDALHEVRGGVVAEVRRDVADPQTVSAGIKVVVILVGRLVQRRHLGEGRGGGDAYGSMYTNTLAHKSCNGEVHSFTSKHK